MPTVYIDQDGDGDLDVAVKPDGSVVVDSNDNANNTGDFGDPNFGPGNDPGDTSIDPDGNVVPTPCFLPGTMVRTPAGEVAIETLKRGDLVMTADGKSAPIRWIGRRTVAKAFAGERSMPILVKADALGAGLPARDLYVSPAHALFIDGVLVQASALVNGTSVVRHTGVADTFTYLHIELPEHALIVTEGVASETFVDNVTRMSFDNWAEHEALPDEAPVGEMPYPRAQSLRQVPAAIRERLFGSAVAKVA